MKIRGSRMKGRSRLLIMAVTVAAAISLCPLLANETIAADRQQIILEEVVVQSRRRQESALDTPMAVSVLTTKQLDTHNLIKIAEISHQVPGFTISNYNQATPQFYLRGIGSNTSGTSNDPSVAVFIDDIYIARPGFFDRDLFNLASIEVLRGPQGTLYGKNAAGGVVRITPRRPSEATEVAAEFTTGSRDLQRFNLYASGALSKSSQSNLAFSRHYQDGFVENSVSDENERNSNSTSLRTQTRINLNDKLDVRLSFDKNWLKQNGNGRGLAGPALLGAIDTPARNQHAKTDTPVPGFTRSESEGLSLHINQQTDAGEWVSITGLRQGNYQFRDEILPVTYAPVLVNSAHESSDQISQELRFHAILSRYNLVAGSYFLKEQVQRDEYFDYRGATYILTGSVLESALHEFLSQNKTQSTALFSDLDYSISDDWSINLGARYTHERKQFSSQANGGDPLNFGLLETPYTGVNESKTWQNLSFKLGSQWFFNPQQLVYLSWSQGFKSGAYNSLASSETAARKAVDPEHAKQWEVGYKASWLSNRIHSSLVGFYLDYQDLQVYQVSNGVISVENAAEGRSQGLELELTAKPTTQLDAKLTYAWLDTEYLNYRSNSGEDFSGNRLLRSPEHSGSISISYLWYFSFANIQFQTDTAFVDKRYFAADNAPVSKLDAYQLSNLRLHVIAPTEEWRLSLWAKNIFNEKYYVFANEFQGTQTRIPGQPVNLGVTLKLSF